MEPQRRSEFSGYVDTARPYSYDELLSVFQYRVASKGPSPEKMKRTL
jgi:hypothetical protein